MKKIRGSTQIKAGTVTNTELANMAENTLKGVTAAGVPQDLTTAQVISILPDVVSGGASGLMTGADKAKLDGIDAEDIDMVFITEDLTDQIDGSTYHFDVTAPMETWPIITCNLEQLPSAVTSIDDDGLGFTTSILLASPDTLTVKYNVKETYLIVDGDGNFVYDAEGDIIMEV